VAEEFDRRHRGAGAVGPDLVDQIGGRDERHLPRELFGEVLDLARRVQPGIEAELATRRHEVADAQVEPALRGLEDGDRLAVGFERGLQGVAAVDEQAGLLRPHDGDARRAGEARDVGEARFALGHRLATMGVGARDKEAVEPGVGDGRA